MTHNHDNKALLVKVPEGASGFSIKSGPYSPVHKAKFICYKVDGTEQQIPLPPATYGQPFLASEAGEEQAKGLVKGNNGGQSDTMFRDYTMGNSFGCFQLNTPTASLHSLCLSKGWEPGECLIIPILK